MDQVLDQILRMPPERNRIIYLRPMQQVKSSASFWWWHIALILFLVFSLFKIGFYSFAESTVMFLWILQSFLTNLDYLASFLHQCFSNRLLWGFEQVIWWRELFFNKFLYLLKVACDKEQTLVSDFLVPVLVHWSVADCLTSIF